MESLAQNNQLAEALAAGERRNYGYGRPLESWEERGVRFVAVGDRAYGNKGWRTFTDFLFFFLREVVGPDWWGGQTKLPTSQRHPMIRQAALFVEAQANATIDRNGLYFVVPTAPMSALLFLAYDLYLCAHNETIPPLLIDRLKIPDLYEGALYEAHVAGLFARAGFKIIFEDESQGGKRHCEFTAQCKGTGALFSVEAKAVTTRSSRSGHSERPPHFRGKLYEALRKDVEHPRMVFVELNRANSSQGSPQWLNQIAEQLKEAEANLTIDGRPAPPAYVYVTNRPLLVHRGGFELGGQIAISGFKIDDFPPERLGGVLAMQKARLKHIEAYQVMRAAQQLSVIPSRFVRDPLAIMLDASERERAGRRDAAAFHPLDMFDWLFATYKDSTEDKLREWLSGHFPVEYLAT
jgi:hypothetical protein